MRLELPKIKLFFGLKKTKKTLFWFFKTSDNVDSVFYQDLGKRKDFVLGLDVVLVYCWGQGS